MPKQLPTSSAMAPDTLTSKGALSSILSFITIPNVLIVVAIGVTIRLYRQYARLSQFKGPTGVAISKKWLLFDCLWSTKMHLVLWEVNKKYGQYELSHIARPRS